MIVKFHLFPEAYCDQIIHILLAFKCAFFVLLLSQTHMNVLDKAFKINFIRSKALPCQFNLAIS